MAYPHPFVWIVCSSMLLAPCTSLAQDTPAATVEGKASGAEADKPKNQPKLALQRPRNALIADAADGLVAQLETSFKQQFQSTVKGELFFIRTLCQPTRQQLDQLIAGGDQAIKDAAATSAQLQKALLQNRNRSKQATSYRDPRRLIAEALHKSVTPILSAEQAAAYQQEFEKRAAFHKRAVLLSLIARFDQELLLTVEQRGKLEATLSEQWDDAWPHALEIMQQGNHLFPNLDHQLLPILTPRQKLIWGGLSKVEPVHIARVGVDFMPPVQLDDVLDWDDTTDSVLSTDHHEDAEQ